MARWTGYPEVAPVLEAGDAWRNRCFVNDGSILTERNLWTVSGLKDLVSRHSDHPLSGNQDFLAKLNQQLTGASAATIQLAAEALWFMNLFPGRHTLKASTKREQVQSVWLWSGEPAPESEFLSDAALEGVGNPGTAYFTLKPLEFEYLLRTMIAFKELPGAERVRLMAEDVPWTFMTWLDSQPGSDRRLVRGALLYFLFPDYLERNMSRDHKQQIYSALKDKLSADQVIKSRSPSVADYDRAISFIRAALAHEKGNNDLDFYDDVTKPLWFTQLREASVKQFTTAMNAFFKDRGLQMNQPGRDLPSLDEKRSLDPATGFWRTTNMTSKPPRWLIHFDLTGTSIAAQVPVQHRASVIGYANTASGESGALVVRILPVVKVAEAQFREVERWEWLFLLCFPNGLKAGSAAEIFDSFDVQSGVLTYMKQEQPYIFSGLLCLNTPEDSVSFDVAGLKKSFTYREATDALQSLINVASNAVTL